MNELLLNVKCVGLLKAVNFPYVLTHNLVAFYVDLGKKKSYVNHMEGQGLTPRQEEEEGNLEVLNDSSMVSHQKGWVL